METRTNTRVWVDILGKVRFGAEHESFCSKAAAGDLAHGFLREAGPALCRIGEAYVIHKIYESHCRNHRRPCRDETPSVIYLPEST